MKVVPNRPGRNVLLALLLLLLLAAGVAGGYLYGYWAGMGGKAFALDRGQQLGSELREARAEAKHLRQQVANLTLSSAVDRQANNNVRDEVIELREQIAALEEDITFYRSLMAPSESANGLALGEVSLLATGNPNRFTYKIVVQQLATRRSVVNGTLTVTLVGHLADGSLERLALHELSPSVEQKNIKLRFKYFQNIEGDLTLPEGFTPEKIELEARSTGKNADTASKSFSWLVRDL
jgi:hypothetical protein